MKKCCGNCVFYGSLNARAYFNDPAAVFNVCTWKPMQPDWMPSPYIMQSRREPTDGSECPCFAHKGDTI